jgi:glycerophosphoryl diester phosphodiesterase
VAARTQIQSFDHRTLLALQSRHPALQAVFLLGEQRPLAARNAQDPPPAASGPATHWLGDVPWPQRQTYREHPHQVSPDGGIEGLAIAPDGRTLYPMLARAPGDGPPDVLPIFEFDLATRRFAPAPWATFLRAPTAIAATGFILTDAETGFVIERDGRQGDLGALKRIVAVERQSPGANMTRAVACDLMRLADPRGLSGRPGPGDIGLGPVFAMPFAAFGGLVELGPRRLGLVSDNRYPFGSGRHRSERPDEVEFVVIELPAQAP